MKNLTTIIAAIFLLTSLTTAQNYSLSFDGVDDYVSIGDNSDFDPYDPNESIDSDGDGVGDNSDVFPSDSYESIDSDGDGVGDNSDIFPNDSNETVDTDRDGVGDNSDAFPNNPTETADADGDGVGDNSDAFPNNPDETVDTDGDGVGDKSDYAPDDAGIQQFSDYIDIDIEIVFLGLCIIVLAFNEVCKLVISAVVCDTGCV